MLALVHHIMMPDTSEMSSKLPTSALTFQGSVFPLFFFTASRAKKGKERFPSGETSTLKLKTDLKCRLMMSPEKLFTALVM